MFFKCKKEYLTKAISKLDKITGKNLSLPILSCVEIKTENNELSLRATNLDVGLEIKIPAKIEKKGEVIIPSNILNNFLSNLKTEEMIEIKEEGKNIEVISKEFNILIKTLSKEDFPSIPKIKSNKKVNIEAVKFINGLKSVAFSASTSNIKPELSSVYIKQENGKLYFVSTDSFRLSEKTITIKNNDNFEEILIPQKNINEIIRVIEDIEGDIEIIFDENQVAFKTNNIYLISRIINGDFPDYKQIIPKEFKTNIIALKEDCLNALKLSNIFSDKLNQTLFEIKKKIFRIKTSDSNIGSSSIKIESKIKGDDVSVNFNHRYLTECFNSINTESVEISLSGPGKPMLIKGFSNDSYLYIVMPMTK